MAHNKTEDVTASQELPAEKPLLVLLHGTSGFSEDWSGVTGSLSENRVVIRPDYMAPTAGTAYTATMAEAASRVLSATAATSESPFDLVGYSLGAGVPAFIAAEHPEVVRSLVLISGFAYGGDVWMKLAVASPMPLLAPVMTTTLSLIPGIKFYFLFSIFAARGSLKFRGSMIGGVASSCRPPRDCNRRDRKRSQRNNGDRNTGARRACRYRSRPPPLLPRRTRSPRPRSWRQIQYAQPWRPHRPA